jgi:hypothetical protein
MTPSLIIKHIIIYRRLLRNKELDMIERHWKRRCKRRICDERMSETILLNLDAKNITRRWRFTTWRSVLLYRQSGPFHTKIHAAYTIEVYSIKAFQSS